MWFWQLLWQGLVLGLLVSAALVVPSPGLKALCVVAVFYVLFRLGSDPKWFYRRMFRTVLGAMIVAPSLSVAGEAVGLANTPWFTGFVSLTAKVGEMVPTCAWVALALACLAADLFLVVRPERKAAALITPSASEFSISPNKKVYVSSMLTVTNDTGHVVTVTEAKLTLRLLAPISLKCRLSQQKNGSVLWEPVTATDPLVVPARAGSKVGTGVVKIEVDLPKGWLCGWLVLRSKLSKKLTGDVWLAANYPEWQAPREIRFEERPV